MKYKAVILNIAQYHCCMLDLINAEDNKHDKSYGSRSLDSCCIVFHMCHNHAKDRAVLQMHS